MACDIFEMFMSSVRAVRESGSTNDCPVPRTINTESISNVFNTRALFLNSELMVIKNHIAKACELSIALASDDVVRQKLYKDLTILINTSLEQSSKLLDQLRRYSESKPSKNVSSDTVTQLHQHQSAVCRILEQTLASLKWERDAQVDKYRQRLELTGRLSGGKNSFVRQRNRSWLSGQISADTSEAISVTDISEKELQILETENAEMYLKLLSERSEVTQLGTSVSEISRLQLLINENLVEQAEKAERIGDNVVGSTELIKEANDKLREAIDRTKGVRFWILFIVLLLTFSLHFLDWYG